MKTKKKYMKPIIEEKLYVTSEHIAMCQGNETATKKNIMCVTGSHDYCLLYNDTRHYIDSEMK